MNCLSKRILHCALLVGSVVAAALLDGCSSGLATGTATGPTTVTVAAGQYTGVVMGAQQPVGMTTLQMYQTGTSGYGSAATALFPAGSVKTTASGNFTLPSFTCTAGTYLYLVGTGGQPVAGATNANLGLMAGLGLCSTVQTNIANGGFISVNEVTTVSSIWALSPFMTGLANVGTSTNNTTGLGNAFAAINKIVNIPTGALPGPLLPAGATLPTSEIDTLADILVACVNSGGGGVTSGVSDGTACGNLFKLAPNAAGATYPTDTITAAMNIAQNPSRNVAALTMLEGTSPLYQPALSVNTPPNAFTIAITYTGGGLNSPHGVATDASGNVWVANTSGNSVSEFASSGAPVSGASGFNPIGSIAAPYALAIDQSGYIWVASTNNSVTKLAPSGSSGTVYTGNGLSTPKSIAIDGAGNAWVANSAGATVSAFTSNGSVLSGSPFSGGGVADPAAIAISPK
jgi:hypothetical protein